jgi:DNA adenine methylase
MNELPLQMIPRRPVLRYHGGKWMLSPWIISHFPEHRTYVEPFGGAASVLLRKERSKVEIYNDLDEEITGFFRVLRDDTMRARLVFLVEATPFSRREFRAAYEPTTDPVEAARRVLVRSWFGFGSDAFNIASANGFKTRDTMGRKSYAREWAGLPEIIQATANRFASVTLEARNALQLIPQYDSPSTLFYIDPPYPWSARNSHGAGYKHELGDAEHRLLAAILNRLKGRVVLSGYRCALYDELYRTWRSVERRTFASGQVTPSERTEVLWMNFVSE